MAKPQPDPSGAVRSTDRDPTKAGLRPPWKPGESPNPGGKPVGARNRLNAAFLNAMVTQFDKNGAKAIEKVAKEDPATFVRVCAAILPKEMELSRPLDEISDEQLNAAAVAIRAILAAQGDRVGSQAPASAEPIA
jgi:formiminotetrahydrofolate cyclodeaminase